MAKSYEELAAEITCVWLQGCGTACSGAPGPFLNTVKPETVGEFYKKVYHAILEALREEARASS